MVWFSHGQSKGEALRQVAQLVGVFSFPSAADAWPAKDRHAIYQVICLSGRSLLQFILPLSIQPGSGAGYRRFPKSI